MRNDKHNIEASHLPESILVISLSEAAAPSESLVWIMSERAVAEISQRIEVMGLPLQAPALLKMRSLSPSLKKLLATTNRVALIAGLRIDSTEAPIIHQTYRAVGKNIIQPPGAAFGATGIVADETVPDRIPFSRPMPKPWAKQSTAPLISTLHANGELSAMPVWLEDDLPPGGFDFLGIPLPAAESGDWMLPQLGAGFPEVTEAITGILWPIVQEISPPQVGESAG